MKPTIIFKLTNYQLLCAALGAQCEILAQAEPHGTQ